MSTHGDIASNSISGPDPARHSVGWGMHKRRAIGSFSERPTAKCAECGAMIPLIGERWLAAHREGVAELGYLPGSGRRCPGSLLCVAAAKVQTP